MNRLSLRVFSSASAAERTASAQRALAALAPGTPAVVIGASRAAADECAARVAFEKGGLFGVVRVGYQELVTRLALPALARDGLSPSGALSAEAVAARAAFEAAADHALEYFAPVATLPGFPRALSRTLGELQLAGVATGDLETAGSAARDLATLLARVNEQAAKSGTVDRATLVATATEALRGGTTQYEGALLVLLDVSVATAADVALVRALVGVAADVVATVPAGDDRTLAALETLGATRLATTSAPGAAATSASALARLQQHLFSSEAPPAGTLDDSVSIFSAPGEGRECVEIARRVIDEASRGVPFDEIAVLLRAPQTYLGLLEHALTRAGIPAWFERGTRRPDPSGRAFLALLACADEELSARRFAEYLSLGQVPHDTQDDAPTRGPRPSTRSSKASSPPPNGRRIAIPKRRRALAAKEDGRGRVVAGTLRAPWRWEELLVESAVIGQLDRWERRLRGLRAEYQRKRDELESDEPESPRIAAIRRDIDQLDHLEAFALADRPGDGRMATCRREVGRVARSAPAARAARAASAGARPARPAGARAARRGRTGLAARSARGADAAPAAR